MKNLEISSISSSSSIEEIPNPSQIVKKYKKKQPQQIKKQDAEKKVQVIPSQQQGKQTSTQKPNKDNEVSENVQLQKKAQGQNQVSTVVAVEKNDGQIRVQASDEKAINEEKENDQEVQKSHEVEIVFENECKTSLGEFLGTYNFENLEKSPKLKAQKEIIGKNREIIVLDSEVSERENVSEKDEKLKKGHEEKEQKNLVIMKEKQDKREIEKPSRITYKKQFYFTEDFDKFEEIINNFLQSEINLSKIEKCQKMNKIEEKLPEKSHFILSMKDQQIDYYYRICLRKDFNFEIHFKPYQTRYPEISNQNIINEILKFAYRKIKRFILQKCHRQKLDNLYEKLSYFENYLVDQDEEKEIGLQQKERLSTQPLQNIQNDLKQNNIATESKDQVASKDTKSNENQKRQKESGEKNGLNIEEIRSYLISHLEPNLAETIKNLDDQTLLGMFENIEKQSSSLKKSKKKKQKKKCKSQKKKIQNQSEIQIEENKCDGKIGEPSKVLVMDVNGQRKLKRQKQRKQRLHQYFGEMKDIFLKIQKLFSDEES